MKRIPLTAISAICALCSNLTATADGRWNQSLSGDGWSLWIDKEASWENDRLYLPYEITDISLLPVNAPTGGWATLDGNHGAIAVSVPGTVEEYTTGSKAPRPEDSKGVTWWYRTFTVPESEAGKRTYIDFESVRMRAEVYIDGQLAGYDLIGETPFSTDITEFVTPGKEQMLAVRVTNPGGNFHWQDFDRMNWGKYTIQPARGFSGMIGRVKMSCKNPVNISDIYMQNTPSPRKVNAIISLRNDSKKDGRYDIQLNVVEKGNPNNRLLSKMIKGTSIPKGESLQTIELDAKEAKIWDLDNPNLYECIVEIKKKGETIDNDSRTFGFRSFTVDGVGENAVFRLNGRRVMLRSAISWGYFPIAGLAASPEIARKQVTTAKELGLNMLNFHRSIGSPVVLETADELGLLYYEEPGSFHSGNHDPFLRAIINEKLHRMVKRDRSHPSLIIYNLINEFGGALSRDSLLVAKRMNDMRVAHAIDPSRPMTFTSGWAGKKDDEEDAKAHFLPFDSTLYRKGWWDNHRAGGPDTWLESYYQGPDDNIMYSDNAEEILVRGEEGAISTPPRIQLIHDRIMSTGQTGWDGLFWLDQYDSFVNYFNSKNLAPHFGTLDNLTLAMGDVSFEHQGRRIQGMRMQNLGDAYMINGWESMPYDNHSGVVDIYRNPKGHTSVLSYYTQPLYIAVATRNQVVKVPGSASVDFYIVNEKDVNGAHRLEVDLIAPDGTKAYSFSKEVDIIGGETFGQPLIDAKSIPVPPTGGTYKIEASLLDPKNNLVASGHDEIIGIGWSPEDLSGNGAFYGTNGDKAAAFYKKATGNNPQSFDQSMGMLDWIVVNRPSLDAPTAIPDARFTDGTRPTMKATWYKDADFIDIAAVKDVTNIDRSFVDGAQPDESVAANQPFGVIWEGDIIPEESGQYLISIQSNRGIRMFINDEQLVDEYHNNGPELEQTRPVIMEAGKPTHIKVMYRQTPNSGYVRLKWSQPNAVAVAPEKLLERVRDHGTTLILLGSTETWIKPAAEFTGIDYYGYYRVGKDWIGGNHFVKDHPLFSGLPVNCALNWPYQNVVRDGENRFGFLLKGEELVAGSYRSMPFELGTAVGVIPCGKGRIVFSTLDIADNLDNPSGPAEVARKLFCNFIRFASEAE